MEIIANQIQTVAVNQNVLFTDTVVKCNKYMSHREGSGLITLRGNRGCECQCNAPARYLVTFSGNIAVPTGQTVGPISLSISNNGEPIASTTMIVTPAAVDEYFNVAGSVYIDAPYNCCTTVSAENTSTIPINVQNANLIAVRTA